MDSLRETLRRWALCRCAYARSPAGPCRCSPETLLRAEREKPADTRRWERQQAAKHREG